MERKHTPWQILSAFIYYKSNEKVAIGPVRKVLRLRQEKEHREHAAAIQKELDALHESGKGFRVVDGKPIRFKPFSSRPEFKAA